MQIDGCGRVEVDVQVPDVCAYGGIAEGRAGGGALQRDTRLCYGNGHSGGEEGNGPG